MQVIVNDLIARISEDTPILGALLVCLGLLWLCNTILGGVMAFTGEEWNTKKFFLGIVKGLLIGIVIMVFFVVTEAFPIILNGANGIVEFNADFVDGVIGAAQVFGTCVVGYKKFAAKIYKKLLVLMESSEEEVNNSVINLHLKDEDSVEPFEEG